MRLEEVLQGLKPFKRPCWGDVYVINKHQHIDSFFEWIDTGKPFSPAPGDFKHNDYEVVDESVNHNYYGYIYLPNSHVVMHNNPYMHKKDGNFLRVPKFDIKVGDYEG